LSVPVREGLSLELWLPADWARIDHIREAVRQAVDAVFGQANLREAASMVCAELLENAVKHGDPAQGIHLVVRDLPGILEISVDNGLEKKSSQARTLKQRIAWLQTFSDREEAYKAALTAVFEKEKADAAPESGLGLARVAYEGGADLELSSSTDPSRVLIRARIQIGSSGAPASDRPRPPRHVVRRDPWR
jgi:hypothetical protein